ncbi:MAG: dihydroneopterin aldolase [Alphaproteobacteria bacterium]|nr:dihydroneopterin aldolase [Alphaproteobacteria bacterium]
MATTVVPTIDPVEARLLERQSTIRKLFFRDLEIQAHIGINDSEQGQSQNVLVNITLYMAPGERPQRDSIREVFNYDQVRDALHRLIDGRHINLQETLVEEIADMCFGFDAVVAVRVSSEKTDVYDDCAGVGSEVVRLREE